MKRILISLLCAMPLLASCNHPDPTPAPEPTPGGPTQTTAKSDTTLFAPDPTQWAATDAIGRQIDPAAYPAAYPAARGKKVGIFYFIWHGCHGYDKGANNNQVVLPTASDTQSPYDNNRLLAANPTAPAYGGQGVMHHWGEPYLGYYIMNDNWVIRKHAQMLSDAGVDVIFFDVTNAFTYIPVVKNLCTQYIKLRRAGCATPQVAFLIHSRPEQTIKTIYEEFYNLDYFKELWFEWDGKPLILCPTSAAAPEHLSFFTFRESWFANDDGWFGSGQDKWSWGDYWPQRAGWHTSAAEPECMPIMPATHPHMNIGRSYYNGVQPSEADCRSGEGLFFSQQIARALEVDPQMVFITGWNEWTAQKNINGVTLNVSSFCGKPAKAGDAIFVDQYNHEYSRDLEPVRGGFGDNYYYQMTDFIRRFKGIERPAAHTQTCNIKIDGDFDEWNAVKAGYGDDNGDTYKRNTVGWGRIGRYVNSTGRNDIVVTKVAAGQKSLNFYVRCADPITSPAKAWMRLFIAVHGSKAAAWEGFGYALNIASPADGKATLSRCGGGWSWSEAAKVDYAVNGREMEVSIPYEALGITDVRRFGVDFKWIDNACATGDIMECMTDGDAAPNGRFRYRYLHE